ncbi:Dual specificity tyrosine-phosphorylation-regulated kinase 1A [Blyttiomyces sp. JEL0837]|nr:Dual specificity tyrosine-phosphorylation-regulated kinase 1A [Blyttiomyces sp. JEL0837]
MAHVPLPNGHPPTAAASIPTASMTGQKIPSSSTHHYGSAFRSHYQSPLVKLSAGLAETYIKFNKFTETRRKRSTATTSSTATDTTKRTKSNNNGYDDENDDYIVRENETWDDRYVVIKLLGRGSFGQVVEAYDQLKNEKVAVKIIKNRKTFFNQAQIEIRILEFLNNLDSEDSKHIALEKNRLFRNSPKSNTEICSTNLDRAEVPGETRRSGYSLRLETGKDTIVNDKIEISIMLYHASRSALKVIDFGSSCFYHDKVYTYIQSRFYRSPEVILGHSYTVSIDMWSLGCILVELFSGEPIFCGQTEHDQMCRIYDVLGNPPPRCLEIANATKLNKMFVKVGEGEYRIIPSANSGANGKGVVGMGMVGGGGSSSGYKYQHSARGLSNLLYCFRDRRKERAQAQGSANVLMMDDIRSSAVDFAKFVDLVERMLVYDPKERVTPEEALMHPFFTKVSNEKGCNTSYTMYNGGTESNGGGGGGSKDVGAGAGNSGRQGQRVQNLSYQPGGMVGNHNEG